MFVTKYCVKVDQVQVMYQEKIMQTHIYLPTYVIYISHQIERKMNVNTFLIESRTSQ